MASVLKWASSRTDMLRPYNTGGMSVVVLTVWILAMPSHSSHPFLWPSCVLLLALRSLMISPPSAICMYTAVPWCLNNDFLAIVCSELGARRGFLDTSERWTRPNQKNRFFVILRSNRRCLRFMKERSVKVPALKDLLDRPLNLRMELVESAMRAAGFGAGWSSTWANAFRSLKPHGSSPERVLDLLCFLKESRDEKMQQMDLDDVTVEQVAAARGALREAIRDLELALKKGERWNFCQVAPWLWFLNWPSWSFGSTDLRWLQALDARVSILMMRLEQEAEKENDAACLKEVALNSIGTLAFCFVDPKWSRFGSTVGMKRVTPILTSQKRNPPLESTPNWHFVFDPQCFWFLETLFFVVGMGQQPPRQISRRDMMTPPKRKQMIEVLIDFDPPLEWRVVLVVSLRVCCWYQTTISEANLKTKHDELHIQVQQLTQECERLKEEESKRQAVTWQLQQVQLECENLRKGQEESECERLKERQAVALQLQELKLECEHLRKKQEESESERLKEKSQRQARTLQLQALQLEQLQLENEKLKKKEFKFKSLVATAQSLKSKVEQFCNECEKCDAEDVSEPDSSWEVCTPMTEASGISIDTAGRCFMTDAVFKASEVSD